MNTESANDDTTNDVTSAKFATIQIDLDDPAVEAEQSGESVQLVFDNGGFSGRFTLTADEAEALADELEEAVDAAQHLQKVNSERT
jgi:hypothetical protein